MGFINIEKLKKKYTEEPMLGNVQRLEDFDDFHCLLSGSISTSIKVSELFGKLPVEYLEWSKVCDGGLLFDTCLLSTQKHDVKLDMDFDTLYEINSDVFFEERGIPKNYGVIAIRSYGDLICISKESEDQHIYLWDIDNGVFTEAWDTFTDWLTEEIDDGIRLISEGVLEPLAIKLGGDNNE